MTCNDHVKHVSTFNTILGVWLMAALYNYAQPRVSRASLIRSHTVWKILVCLTDLLLFTADILAWVQQPELCCHFNLYPSLSFKPESWACVWCSAECFQFSSWIQSGQGHWHCDWAFPLTRTRNTSRQDLGLLVYPCSKGSSGHWLRLGSSARASAQWLLVTNVGSWLSTGSSQPINYIIEKVALREKWNLEISFRPRFLVQWNTENLKNPGILSVPNSTLTQTGSDFWRFKSFGWFLPL
jgi:hypothetical protein